jgi:hypothetical protein
MGTRSSIGVHVNGKDKLTYNQYDGYPTGVGKQVYEQICALIKQHGWDGVVKLATKLKQVKSDKEFTEKQKEKYGDLWQQVSTGKDMYSLLRGLQGDLGAMLERGIMTKDNEFIKDSLFCEWAYILNVDEQTFEIYQGFQSLPHTQGRYATCKEARGYYACALIHTIDLSSFQCFHDAFALGDDFWSKLEQGEEVEVAA